MLEYANVNSTCLQVALIMADLIFKFSSSKTAEICISAVFLLCVKSEAGAV